MVEVTPAFLPYPQLLPKLATAAARISEQKSNKRDSQPLHLFATQSNNEARRDYMTHENYDEAQALGMIADTSNLACMIELVKIECECPF